MPNDSPISTTTVSEIVPNCFPRVDPGSNRLAVVGEAPGADEVVALEPFVGTSGRFLRAILSGCGASCSQTFFGNVCQHRPPNNDIDTFDFNGPELQSGVEQLKTDLRVFQPNCVLLLGRTAFRVFRPDLCYEMKRGTVVPLASWRGSIFKTREWDDVKAIGTYHPAYILRTYTDKPFFTFDVARAVKHSGSRDFRPLVRTGILRPTLYDALQFISDVRTHRTPTTFDIEGYPDSTGVTMLSLVPTADPTRGIVIPFVLGGSYWTEDEEVQVWQALAALLADADVPKTAHNCFYELFVLAWRHRCVVNNLDDDTMMAHWESYPDFARGDKEEKADVSMTQKKRSLGICCSLYTDQPFYKDDRLSDNQDTRLNYNFLDSSVTAEVRNVVTRQLQRVPASYAHYRFNISLIPPYNYIMLRGCQFDAAKAGQLAKSAQDEVDHLNLEINRTLEQRGVFNAFPVSKGKEKHRATEGFNVKSPNQKAWLIYDHLKCTPLKRWGRSADEDALLHFYQKTRDPLLRLVIRCVRKRTRVSDIGKLLPDTDGRIRTSLDLVGTNTGRLASRNSMAVRWDPEEGEWVNTGTNLQNQPEELRVCLTADSPDTALAQWDLSGADAWTVAAELAALGYPTMLEDLLFGLKPSLILFHMIMTHSKKGDVMAINRLSRDELREITRSIKVWLDSVKGQLDPATGRPLDWLYLCCKRVQHGSNYAMQAQRTAELVFGDSDGTVDLSVKDAELYQSLYKLRYKTDARNQWIRQTLSRSGCITTSCGMRRQFFAIRSRASIDDAIVREASSVNPQCNTTYVTNHALRNLWYDVANRTTRGGLFVEPLIQVHDALIVQFPRRLTQWVGERMRQWFRVPIRVSGIEVNIPVEGKWGDSWGTCTNPFPK